MKRKIIIYLMSLFLFFGAGSVLTVLYINNTIDELSRLIKLHQIEDLRQHMIIEVQAVQSDLYTVGTHLGRDLNLIVENVSKLDKSAEHCLSCHHEPAVTADLKTLQRFVRDYEEALSEYITASANVKIIDSLKLKASSKGTLIISETEGMSIRAAEKLRTKTSSAMQKIQLAKQVLYATVAATFILCIIIAVRLTLFVTRPVNKLVHAARSISLGDLGTTVDYRDSTEFGELVDVFNRMSEGLETGYSKLHEEIIQRTKTQEALRQSEERYALAARGANDGLWDWNLVQNKIHFSSRWKTMLGYNDNEIGEDPEEWFRLVHQNDRRSLEAKISAHRDGHTLHLESEYRMLHKDGAHRWMLTRGLALRDIKGNAYRMAGSQTDITSRKLAEEQLLHDAFHDALTGLPNRALFMDRIEHRFRQAKDNAQRNSRYLFAVLFIDLDRFKVINDSMGHLTGDMLLVAVSERLSKAVRPGDTVARLGGDEFAVILENISDSEHAEQITDRLEKEIAMPFMIDGHEIITSASIGIALSSLEYESAEFIIRDADIAMYHAKARGKAHHQVFEAEMYSSTVERMHLETDLRRAVEHGEFVMHYQPIINLGSGELAGFEALIRWNSPKRGMVYPVEFIPIAEETGLILSLGDWILNETCRQLQVWQQQYPKQPPLKMSVNISGRQFLQHDLPERVEGILRQYGLEAGSLTIEITESMIMENVEATVEVLKRLRSMGLHIHIDDFGTGYSSLSYIQKFPVQALKIDKSFIENMQGDEDNLHIVRTIIALAENLKLELVAEGLETLSQLSQVKEMNCQYGQGYYLSRPMDPKALEAYIEKNLFLQPD